MVVNCIPAPREFRLAAGLAVEVCLGPTHSRDGVRCRYPHRLRRTAQLLDHVTSGSRQDFLDWQAPELAAGLRPATAGDGFAAADEDQAGFIANAMRVEKGLNPWLQPRVTIGQGAAHGHGGRLEVLTSDAGSTYGRSDDFVVCDGETVIGDELTRLRSRPSHRDPRWR